MLVAKWHTLAILNFHLPNSLYLVSFEFNLRDLEGGGGEITMTLL